MRDRWVTAGDPADSGLYVAQRQPGEFLGRAQAHGTIVAGRVRAVPEGVAAATRPASAKILVIVRGGAHSVHPDVLQQLQ